MEYSSENNDLVEMTFWSSFTLVSVSLSILYWSINLTRVAESNAKLVIYEDD